MKPIELTLERTVRAPIEQVYARLLDLEGHNGWMAGTKSMLRRTRQTSPGEPTVGTTFVDETRQGLMPGEVAELAPPHTIVFHWWQEGRSGKRTFEGWPRYDLEPAGDGGTVVRHSARLVAYGVWRAGAPLWRVLAVRERTITLEALQASFERDAGAAA